MERDIQPLVETNGKKTKSKKTAESVRYKDVFTTGDVALICEISQQTVIRCFEAEPGTPGKLKGYRVPGSKHRRIVRSELVKFMVEAGIPTEMLTGKTEDTEEGEEDHQ